MTTIRVKDKDFLNNVDAIARALVNETQSRKTFRVTIDVTFSGDVEIEAKSIKEARAKALEQAGRFTPSDLRWFHFLNAEIYDCEEVED